MIAYKGFNPDLTCRGFQYAEGEIYETKHAELCKTGFHACPLPLDVFASYPPASSVYHEVEVDDDAPTDGSKVASKRIKIGARLDIAGLVKAQFKAIWDGCTVEPGCSASGGRGAAQASGEQGAAQVTGPYSAATAEGSQGVALAAGYKCRARGAKGAWLVLVERQDDGVILGVKTIKVGTKHKGMRIQPDTDYGLVDGSVVEVDQWGDPK